MSYEVDYTKWIEQISAYLRKHYNRDYKSLPFAFELRYFSGYTPKEVVAELETLYPDIRIRKAPSTLIDRAFG